ncbi:hypothetical protein PV336_16215 [Streptomyces sp. MI02-2A]|uniref:hypothetical protein n=1 Tax=Streptomyces sp. MI02-2A TaxID=3028688 RepID=UPI0029A04473|nr:hypothetical protein [Streptomyces sp. MI02-2A]MDX3260766.1 hypothetical protein [Streptomyces sp. MI02-2A]
MEKKTFIARDALAANYATVPGREGQVVALLMQDREGTDAVWVMEEDTVTQVLARLGGGLSDDSRQILAELGKTEILTSYHMAEDEETGLETVHLVLYGHVSCEIPVHDANSAIQMLSTVLHAQGHAQLGN